MGQANTHHDKLRSGIILATAKVIGDRIGGDQIVPIEVGTLSGLARRTDGKKVLVTNLHVVTAAPISS